MSLHYPQFLSVVPILNSADGSPLDERFFVPQVTLGFLIHPLVLGLATSSVRGPHRAGRSKVKYVDKFEPNKLAFAEPSYTSP